MEIHGDLPITTLQCTVGSTYHNIVAIKHTLITTKYTLSILYNIHIYIYIY